MLRNQAWVRVCGGGDNRRPRGSEAEGRGLQRPREGGRGRGIWGARSLCSFDHSGPLRSQAQLPWVWPEDSRETASEEHLFSECGYPKYVRGGRQSGGSFGADNFKGGACHKGKLKSLRAQSHVPPQRRFVSGIKCPAEPALCGAHKA